MAKILIVDDEPEYLEHLSRILSRQGYEVETAESAEQAIELSQRFAPDVLIADWMLRGQLDGLDVARTLDSDNPALVAIVTTGYPVSRLRGRLAESGNVLVLEKPFGADDLLAMVCKAIRATKE